MEPKKNTIYFSEGRAYGSRQELDDLGMHIEDPDSHTDDYDSRSAEEVLAEYLARQQPLPEDTPENRARAEADFRALVSKRPSK